MLRCINAGDTTIKPGHQTTGNAGVIWSDESSFTLFLTSGRVHVSATTKEAFNPEYLVPTVKHRGGSLMVFAAISWYIILLVPLLPFMAELPHGSTQTGWAIRRIPCSRRYFRTTMQFSIMTIPPFTHPPWPSQSPDLNITEPLWSVLETRMTNRFPPQTSLKQPEGVLQEKWYKIPLQTIQNLCETISRRTAAVLKAKGDPTAY
jgi:hypothetical protein